MLQMTITIKVLIVIMAYYIEGLPNAQTGGKTRGRYKENIAMLKSNNIAFETICSVNSTGRRLLVCCKLLFIQD